jgi:hypothetical protein
VIFSSDRLAIPWLVISTELDMLGCGCIHDIFFTEILNFLEQLVAIVSNHFRARLSKALVLTNRYDQRLQNFV